MIRRFGIAIVMAVAATMLVGTSAASAEPQLLRVALYGENIATGGDHAYCRGAYGVRMVSPVGKRGVVRMTLLSHGFRGDGAAWKRDPHCRFLAIVSYTSSRTLLSENVIPVSFSSRPGERVVRDLAIGSGPAKIEVGTYARNSRVRLLQSYPLVFWTVIP